MSHPPSHEERDARWEGNQRDQSRLAFTNLRVCYNTMAHFLASLRISPTRPRLAVADSWRLKQSRRIPPRFRAALVHDLRAYTFMNVKEHL